MTTHHSKKNSSTSQHSTRSNERQTAVAIANQNNNTAINYNPPVNNTVNKRSITNTAIVYERGFCLAFN
jgi:hypothetical protein